ncbi:ribonuclease HI [bacterium]|nr:ribonuclease HI [bacterium]
MGGIVTIYTDGACKGNPGPGGWGAVLIWKSKVKEISGGSKATTNNRMELTAAIRALETLKRKVPVELYSDSSYLVKGMNEWLNNWIRRGWKRAGGEIENLDLWQKLNEVNERLHVKWIWVRGHAGNRYNERADQLAVEAVPNLK